MIDTELELTTTQRAIPLLSQYPPLSYAVIGRVLGCSRQRIQQISQEHSKLSQTVKQRLTGSFSSAEQEEWAQNLDGERCNSAEVEEWLQSLTQTA